MEVIPWGNHKKLVEFCNALEEDKYLIENKDEYHRDILNDNNKWGYNTSVRSEDMTRVVVVQINRLRAQRYQNPKLNKLQKFLTASGVKTLIVME